MVVRRWVRVSYLDITSCVIGPEEMPLDYYENYFVKYKMPYTNFRHGYPKLTEFDIITTTCECCNQEVIKRSNFSNEKNYEKREM